MAPILELTDLHRRYGKIHALRGISLRLTEPGIHGFLGPNGAGKTTTIKLIAGLLRPTSGSVRIQGRDIQRDRVSALQSLGVMMETPRFYDYLSGRNNLRVLARLAGDQMEARIPVLLSRVGLSAKADERVTTYSRGMRQRLGLAAALMNDPELVVLDEPTSGLDPAGIAEVRQWLLDMVRDDGRAVMLSSHQMGEVERICDTLTIINEGSIVASGRASELIQAKNAIIVRTPDIDRARSVLADLRDAERVETISSERLRVESSVLSSADVNRALVSQNIEVAEIVEEKETLEETFFRLVGKPLSVS